jgi:mRNA degradation ribonuclease J1/J2
VPPQAFGALLAKLVALGTVVHHEASSEDKTDEVIDVEARAKNLAAFRDRLREMIGKSGAKLAELIEQRGDVRGHASCRALSLGKAGGCSS